MKKKTFSIVCWTALSIWWLGAAPAPGQSLSESIRSILNRGNNRKVHFSIAFYDIQRRHSVFEFNADRAQKPASNMKLVTTAAALDILGEDFVFRTVYGLYQDNLCIVAGGDPLLGDPVVAQRNGQNIFEVYRQVARALQERGVSAISGGLWIDDFVFDDQRFHPSWPVQQENKWYTAQVSGLCFNDNCIDITFRPGSAPGQPAVYTCVPDTRFVTIVNKCKTVRASQKTAVGVLRKHDTNELTLIGTCGIPLEKPVSATIDNPSAYHGYTLFEFLRDQQIAIAGELVVKPLVADPARLPDGFDVLVEIETPIHDALRESNQRSLNLVAECLFKSMGAWQDGSGRGGSWQSGRRAVLDFLKRISLDTREIVVDDGSGLSHENRISARAMARLLHYMEKSPHARAFRASLATAENGTLSKKHRFSEARYADRVFAKTGYISGANTLSGYCMTRSGRQLAFSILTQNPPASNYDIDKIVKTVIDQY